LRHSAAKAIQIAPDDIRLSNRDIQARVRPFRGNIGSSKQGNINAQKSDLDGVDELGVAVVCDCR
jgi:hypothetical protein